MRCVHAVAALAMCCGLSCGDTPTNPVAQQYEVIVTVHAYEAGASSLSWTVTIQELTGRLEGRVENFSTTVEFPPSTGTCVSPGERTIPAVDAVIGAGELRRFPFEVEWPCPGVGTLSVSLDVSSGNLGGPTGISLPAGLGQDLSRGMVVTTR